MKYVYPIIVAIAIAMLIALLYVEVGPAFALIAGGSWPHSPTAR